jgi:hypothetical protein
MPRLSGVGEADKAGPLVRLDAGLRRPGLSVRPQDVCRVGHAQRRVTIGRYGPFTTEQARDRAKAIIRAAADGNDPQGAKREAQLAIARATGHTLAVSTKDATQLYRHFNYSGELLYVGIASNSLARLDIHKKQSHWFNEIALVTLEHFPTRDAALAAEQAAISRENPRYNISGGYRVEAARLSSERKRAELGAVAAEPPPPAAA